MAFSPEQQREHIRELQKYLHGISYYNEQIPRIIPDGIYGKETTNAVRGFQTAYGLTASGETNRATWDKIVSVYRSLIDTLARVLEVFPRGRSQMIGPGDTGLPVLVIQAILRALSDQYHNLPLIEVTGLYGPDTAGAVRRFQELTALPVTGTVDLYTWNLLAAAGSELAGNPYLR